jgi:hypothetical protein
MQMGETYFGYDGSLAKTSHLKTKPEINSNKLGFRISETSAIKQPSIDFDQSKSRK